MLLNTLLLDTLLTEMITLAPPPPSALHAVLSAFIVPTPKVGSISNTGKLMLAAGVAAGAVTGLDAGALYDREREIERDRER